MSMCCPGMKLNGRGKRKKKLLTVGVLGSIATTVAGCQTSFTGCAAPSATSISGIALLLPGIPVYVIAAQLPEPGLVAFGELQGLDPLRRLPEIEVRYQQARGTTMLGRDGLAVVCDRDHSAAAQQILD